MKSIHSYGEFRSYTEDINQDELELNPSGMASFNKSEPRNDFLDEFSKQFQILNDQAKTLNEF